jgi:hypothetical protein
MGDRERDSPLRSSFISLFLFVVASGEALDAMVDRKARYETLGGGAEQSRLHCRCRSKSALIPHHVPRPAIASLNLAEVRRQDYYSKARVDAERCEVRRSRRVYSSPTTGLATKISLMRGCENRTKVRPVRMAVNASPRGIAIAATTRPYAGIGTPLR